MFSSRQKQLIESYLFMGSPLDLASAGGYLHGLLSGIDSVGASEYSKLSSLLEEIVESLVPSSNASEIVIPLTAGLDSRGILGACLEVFGPSRIRCFTYGNPKHRDVIAAKEVCSRNHVDWQNVDLNGIQWSVPEMIDIAQEVRLRTGALCACGVVRRSHIESLYSPESVILTGFFGGSISEDMVPIVGEEDAEAAAKAFLHSNAVGINGLSISEETLEGALTQFVKKWSSRVREYPGLALGDILNFPFRQAMNIKGSVCYFRNSVSPYEDSRWVAFWASRALKNRQGRSFYRASLRSEYKKVFCLDSDLGGSKGKRRRFSFAKLGMGALGALRPKGNDSIDFAKDMKGDIRANESMRAVLSELCDSFYNRDVLNNPELNGLVPKVLSRPSRRTWRIIDRISKAELHLRAGTLLPAKQESEVSVGAVS